MYTVQFNKAPMNAHTQARKHTHCTHTRTHDTHTKGKDAATRCTLSAPLVMTATAKANLREAIEAHCKASDISLESVFPELAKVNA